MSPDGSAVLVFDLETQRTLEEVGGRDGIRQLRLAVGVTYDPNAAQFQTYQEADAAGLVAALRAAGQVVGYNVLGFDYEVLRPYTSHPLSDVPTVDLMVHLSNTLGWRPRLDDVAAATLGESKAGGGLDAVRWFRQGDLERVIAYCKKDVEITWRLYEFGRQNGYVKVAQRRGPAVQVRVAW